MTPSAGDLAELAAKYATLAELRRDRAAGAPVPPRGVFLTLARRFPGCLNELDTLATGEIEARRVALEAAARGGVVEPWMAWLRDYHALLRAAFAVRLRRGAELAELVDVASLAASRRLDPRLVASLASPPEGRVVPVALGAIAEDHGVPVDRIRTALFPRHRAARR